MQKLLIGPAGPLLVRLMNRRALKRNMHAIFGDRTPPRPDELDNFWALIEHNGGRLVMHRLLQYINDRILHRERWVGALQKAQHKTGLINGSADPVSGAHMVTRYRQLVGDTAIVELPAIGHYPQLESPDEVLKHVLRIFASMDDKDTA
ncbi:MAG: alpha/beta hydrolase [Gammaproteobacteria bacterium]|nr:alpha/beta hydrolase [Gammaproteobacteria bacterium]